MTTSRDHRRDFLYILAIAVGAFLGLSLLPVAVTGPLGRIGGGTLWRLLGMGAAVAPLGLIGYGTAGLIGGGDGENRRLLVFGAALILVLPYWLGILGGIRTIEALPADYLDWPPRLRVVGLMPAFLVVGVVGLIGTAGAVLVGVVGATAATMFTIGWEPFLQLVDRIRDARTAAMEAKREKLFDAESDFSVSPSPPPPKPDQRKSRRQKKVKQGEIFPVESVEQAFEAGHAIKPFSLDYLTPPLPSNLAADSAALDRLGEVLIDTLKTFRVEARLGRRATGPVVTQFEVAPASGVKVNRIAGLADDLALKMAAPSIRIAPIPGRSYVGVEVPNPTPRMVTLRELVSPPHWDSHRSGLPIALGQDLEGRPVMADLTKMPHLLIAGATGSGKSVCINTIVTSLIFRYTERELRMLMIDPKMVELTTYNALPHLIHPVVTNNKDAAKALKWAMYEMEDRYALFSVNNVRNLHEFNRKVRDGKRVVEPAPPALGETEEAYGSRSGTRIREYKGSTKPFIVVIVDELADLMMTVQGEVEKPLAILAQKARATGIHLILATQRPSVNVITGLIKANFPSRIAFRVASKVDSRTILDQNGAETLLGNGDMLFLPPGKNEPLRVQGAFISTEETERVTEWYHVQRELATGGKGKAEALEQEDILAKVQARETEEESNGPDGGGGAPADRDALFREAAETCIHQQLGSTSLLQRKLRIGYGRAARIVDQLYEAGIIGPPDGSKPREVLIAAHQLDEYLSS